MKFSSKEDVTMFLIECERFDLIESSTCNFVPNDEMLEGFIKKRKNTIKHLKDFRKKQITKEQWRHNRYAMMKGIKAFHKSTKGKKFHRSLGRFLASRVNMSSGSMLGLKNVGESLYIMELSEVFKALSSYKTHAWIQFENYMCLSDIVDYEIFLEEAIKTVSKIESELMESAPNIASEHLDFLLATLNFDYIFDHLVSNDNDFKKLQSEYEELSANLVNSEYPYLEALEVLKQGLSSLI